MLGAFLPEVLFGYMLVMTRIAALIMVVPVLGEAAISPRIRFSLAFLIALVVYPVVQGTLPPVAASPFGLGVQIFIEMMIGLFIGGCARLVMSAINVAGTVIAFQSGLSVAQGFDPSQGSQGTLISTFLVLIATVLIFITNLHHLLIAAIVHSFQQFPSGQVPDVGNMAELAINIMAQAFLLAVQIAAPFLVYGLVFYMGLGLVARLMPQLQVFFIAMPLNIMLSFIIFIMVVSVGMTWFLDHFETTMIVFTA
jgi:flagellar biosynthetic protein FliR